MLLLSAVQDRRVDFVDKIRLHAAAGNQQVALSYGGANENNSDAIDTEGAHAVTIGNILSLEWFQALPNGKSQPEDASRKDEDIK